jgi:hypothetical protein
MESSSLCLDIYEHIYKYVDWTTIVSSIQVNKFISEIAKKEILKRIKSKILFAEINAKIKFTTEDLILKKIIVKIGNKEYLLKKYFPAVISILREYFLFSFFNHEWYILPQTLRLGICLSNRKSDNTDTNKENYIFKWKDNKYILDKVI